MIGLLNNNLPHRQEGHFEWRHQRALRAQLPGFFMKRIMVGGDDGFGLRAGECWRDPNLL